MQFIISPSGISMVTYSRAVPPFVCGHGYEHSPGALLLMSYPG